MPIGNMEQKISNGVTDIDHIRISQNYMSVLLIIRFYYDILGIL